jgi:FYVE zinc finger
MAASSSSSSQASLSYGKLTELPSKPGRWVPDEDAEHCYSCLEPFSLFFRKHHCRVCGRVFCNECASEYRELPRHWKSAETGVQRTCKDCAKLLDGYDAERRVERAAAAKRARERRREAASGVLLAQQTLRGRGGYTYVGQVQPFGAREQGKMYFEVIVDDDIVSRLRGDGSGDDGSGDEQRRRTTTLTARREVIMSLLSATAAAAASDSTVRAPLPDKATCRWLCSLRHPYVSAPLSVEVIELHDVFQGVVMRERCVRGSLQDELNENGPLTRTLIRLYGRHVLEALKFFEAVRYPMPHLHPGNVLLVPNERKCVVADFENTVFSMPPGYLLARPKLTAFVEMFGYLLYEMSTALVPPPVDTLHPKPLVVDRHLAPDVPRSVVELLALIFDPQADAEPVTLATLIEHPFFAAAPIDHRASSPPPPVPSSAVKYLSDVASSTNSMLSLLLKQARAQQRVTRARAKKSKQLS